MLNDIPVYQKALNEDGMLFLSGFYSDDIPLIVEACEAQMLKLKETIQRGQWVALKFIN